MKEESITGHYYCEKCGRILHLDNICENCGSKMVKVPDYWTQVRKISFNEDDKKEFIENIVKTNPKFDPREYERTQRFLELKHKNIHFSPIQVPKEMPKKPKLSKVFISYTFIVFAIITYLFLIFPPEIGEEPSMFQWALEIALFWGIPALFYFSNYKKSKEYYELACIDFESYKDKFFEDEVERQKLKLQGKPIEQSYTIHCPVCRSTNVKRISTVNRAVSVGAVGLVSSKIGKQYECKSCHHKW